MLRRALTSVYALWIFAGSRFEPVLYSDRYFAPTLARSIRCEPIGWSNVAERLLDHSGAKDIWSLVRAGENTPASFSNAPKSVICVFAYVAPPWMLSWVHG